MRSPRVRARTSLIPRSRWYRELSFAGRGRADHFTSNPSANLDRELVLGETARVRLLPAERSVAGSLLPDRRQSSAFAAMRSSESLALRAPWNARASRRG